MAPWGLSCTFFIRRTIIKTGLLRVSISVILLSGILTGTAVRYYPQTRNSISIQKLKLKVGRKKTSVNYLSVFASRVTRDWWAQDANIFQSKVSPRFLCSLFSIGAGHVLILFENSDNWQKSEVDYVLYMAMRCTVDGCRSVLTRDAGRCRFCFR